jgi:hypothetical protein
LVPRHPELITAKVMLLAQVVDVPAPGNDDLAVAPAGIHRQDTAIAQIEARLLA